MSLNFDQLGRSFGLVYKTVEKEPSAGYKRKNLQQIPDSKKLRFENKGEEEKEAREQQEQKEEKEEESEEDESGFLELKPKKSKKKVPPPKKFGKKKTKIHQG